MMHWSVDFFQLWFYPKNRLMNKNQNKMNITMNRLSIKPIRKEFNLSRHKACDIMVFHTSLTYLMYFSTFFYFYVNFCPQGNLGKTFFFSEFKNICIWAQHVKVANCAIDFPYLFRSSPSRQFCVFPTTLLCSSCVLLCKCTVY